MFKGDINAARNSHKRRRNALQKQLDDNILNKLKYIKRSKKSLRYYRPNDWRFWHGSYINDADTGLFYLQSRYYSPETGRFLNADALVSTGQGVLGYNMFAYCRNNPACRIDSLGTADVISYSDDGELFSSDDLEKRGSGGNGQTATQNAGKASGRGFPSFSSLKKFLGSAGVGKHWHHIVEQCQIGKSGFSTEQVQNTDNIISIDAAIHAKISAHYSRITIDSQGMTARDWLAGQSFETQWHYGLDVIAMYMQGD